MRFPGDYHLQLNVERISLSAACAEDVTGITDISFTVIIEGLDKLGLPARSSEPQFFQENVETPLAPNLLDPQVIRFPSFPPPLRGEVEPHCVGILLCDSHPREGILKLDHPTDLGFPLLPIQVGDPVFLRVSPLIAVTRQIDDPIDLLEVKLERWHGLGLWEKCVLLGISSCH